MLKKISISETIVILVKFDVKNQEKKGGNMKHEALLEAISHVALASETIEKFCNDPESPCSPYAANLLERISWELHKNAEELKEVNYLYVS